MIPKIFPSSFPRAFSRHSTSTPGSLAAQLDQRLFQGPQVARRARLLALQPSRDFWGRRCVAPGLVVGRVQGGQGRPVVSGPLGVKEPMA